MRFESCHDCLLAFRPGLGKTSKPLELFLESVLAAEEALCMLDGDVDLDERVGAARLGLALESEGAEGEANPLLDDFPGACRFSAPLTCPFRLGYRDLVAVPVRLREACWLGASYTTLVDEELDTGNTAGPFTSSRLISSKCDRSLGPMSSDSVSEWKVELFELFEFVRSGGEPGALTEGG